MSAMSDARTAFILDDEQDICDLLSNHLQSLGFDTRTFNSVNEIELSMIGSKDILFTDLSMPGIDGIELLRRLASAQVPSELVLMSGTDAKVLHAAHLLAIEHGLHVLGKLTKPFRGRDVRALLKVDSLQLKTEQPRFVIDESTIREALDNRRFVVYYQPKVRLKDHRIMGAEALVRLQTAEGEVIPPGEFIPMAEELGMIDEITWQVLDQSVDVIKEIMQYRDDFNLAINICAHTLDDIDFPDRLCQYLDERQLPHHMLSLEVTESALAKEYSNALDVLSRLRLRGLDLALDDFGTGFSMLQQLRDMPFTEMKIDRSFVKDMSTSMSQKIVLRCVEMAHDLDMKTTAEGIEDADTESLLMSMGCDIGQGYLYARPQPRAAFMQQLRREREEP